MTGRIEFSQPTRKAAWERADGICECGCGVPFGPHPKDRPEYDHDLPADLGGDGSLGNCRVLRRCCHRAKTDADIRMIAKARRGEKKRAGLEARPKARLPGGKASPMKRKVGGGWVRREDE